ncbi:MAG: hypothetical protein QM610_13425 [Chitinophagaceae bacterium]
MLYRGMLYVVGVDIKSYLKAVFGLFLLFYLVFVYGIALYCAPVLLGAGIGMFYANYPLKSV